MPSYFDVDKLICEMKSLSEQDRLEFMGVYDCIRSQPTADVVEVVRCKDCKNYELMKSNNQYFCNKFGGFVKSDDFCSRNSMVGED